MTEIERKALAMAIEVREDARMRLCPDPTLLFGNWEALCRAIEQHEAFKREVSEAVADVMDDWPVDLPLQLFIALENLKRFIIAKSDPLVEAYIEATGWSKDAAPRGADILRAAIEKRGGKIVWGEE